MVFLGGSGLRAQQCAEGDCVDGTGTMTWASGDTYTGQWNNGVMDGKGTMTWKDGKRYRGSWKNGLFEGWGALGWPSGEWYEGYFSGGKMEGAGTMQWKNGDRYKGQWKNGRMDGAGAMRFAGGRTVRGIWKEGRPVAGKPADPGNTAMAGAWRALCRCFPGTDAPYNCPSASFVFRGDGGGTFEEREGKRAVSGPIRWELKGSMLTIGRFTKNGKPHGAAQVFIYNAARKWYESRPAPYGPDKKVMSRCVIKKAGAR